METIITRPAIYYVYVNNNNQDIINAKVNDTQRKLTLFFDGKIFDGNLSYDVLVMPTFIPEREGLQII